MIQGKFSSKTKNNVGKTEVVITITKDTAWTVPDGVKSVDVFAVGGGGAGGFVPGGDWGRYGAFGGNGGNGGQVKTATISVTPNEVVNIQIGVGGIAPTSLAVGGDGGPTKFGSHLESLGGYGGQLTGRLNKSGESMRTGGIGAYYDTYNGSVTNGSDGADGFPSPFGDSDELFGASGGGGNTSSSSQSGAGGNTSGGRGAYYALGIFMPGRFYGAGGGGASTISQYTTAPSDGYQGVVKIRYMI